MPPPDILGRGHRRLAPHIYTDQEIRDLLELCGRLDPAGRLAPVDLHDAVRTHRRDRAQGLRSPEVAGCRSRSVGATLTVRQTKFHKSRCLPLHGSVVRALSDYLHARQRFAGPGGDAPLFVSASGSALSPSTVHGVFDRLRQRLGWRARGGHARPRIHDLRHTMVARRVQRWHETGVPIDHAMFWLCTYLGHAKISDTYWYLTGTPELMELVGAKFERFALQGATMSAPVSPSFATLVQEFFTDYMTRQRALSPQTVASYRDSFVLLLRFAERQLGKSAAACSWPTSIAKFLAELPRSPGARAGQLRAQPQHPPGGGALVPEVRRPARHRQPERHRAGLGGADEALRPQDGGLLDPRTDARGDRRSDADLAWSARPTCC